MERRIGLAGMALLGLAVGGCATSGTTYTDTDRFLTEVAVINVTDGSVSPNQTVIIRDGQILDILSASEVRVPSSEQVLSTGGYTVPGLWDMHVHTMTDPDVAIGYNFPLFLANGVTGIRDMGSVVSGIIETRTRLANDPSLPAPRLYVSGPLLDGQALPWYGDLPLVLKSPEDAERELPKLKDAGMNFLKVYDGLSIETYNAVIGFGAANNMPVAGHAPHSVNLKGAAMAGQRTIEHLSPFNLRDCIADPDDWFGRSIAAKFQDGSEAYYTLTQELFAALDMEACRDAFAAMAEQGTYFTPTLVMELNDRSRVPAEDRAYLQPASRDWCEAGLSRIDEAPEELREETYAGYGALMDEMKTAGVKFLAGSDLPNNCLMPGFSLHWELERLVEVGLSPLEALQGATVNAAAAMDRQTESGQVSPGFDADLLILEANPLEDISNLRRIRGVMINGRWLDQAMLDALRTGVLEGFSESAEAAAVEP